LHLSARASKDGGPDLRLAMCGTATAVALRGSPGHKGPGEHLRVTEKLKIRGSLNLIKKT